MKILKPRVGISACLLGEKVRYDGGHKRNNIIIKNFGRLFQWVPVCPEIELGLGTPRETLRLIRIGQGVRMFTTETGWDLSEAMRAFARRRVHALAKENLNGYIFKKDSPSCGIQGVQVFDLTGVATRSGRGLFAEELIRHLPDLPVEDEERLSYPGVRKHFVARVLAYHRRKVATRRPSGVV